MRSRKRRKHGGCLLVLILITAVVVGTGLFGYLYMTGAEPSFNHVIGHHIREDMEETAEELPVIEQGWYYEQLDSKERAMYRVLYNGLTAGEEEIEVAESDIGLIRTIFTSMMADHPELFWLTGGSQITTYEPALGDPYAVVTAERNCTPEEQKGRSAQIEEVVGEYLSQVDTGADDYEKIKQAYDFIIDLTQYNTEADNNQNIYSVFAGHQSVCAGYAKAFQYLLKRQGIRCIYVTGKITENAEKHGWTIVRCHDAYYHVDVTWGDAVYNEVSEEIPSSFRAKNYDYLCCPDEVILRTHEIDETLNVPVCKADDLNYYRLHNMYYTSYDKDTFRQIIFDDVDAQKPYSVFCFADQSLYDAAHDDLTESLLHDGANRILGNTGMPHVRTLYEDEPYMFKIVIYWQYG